MPIFSRLIIILIFLFTFDHLLFAQREDRQFKMPEGNGTISGTVIDKDNNQQVAGATIIVYKGKDSTKVAGAETDKAGQFSISIPFGRYSLEANMIGYGVVTVSGVLVSPKKSDVILDTIKLKLGGTTTEEIEVTAEKSIIQFTPEKKIFNVSETPLVSSGSATDILKNVPSVSVDNDGNVSLRGSQNVRIMVDGRPLYDNATNILESIPASSVESVELITNPSAKYEAEGETGFINVVLKKNQDLGYNGNLMLTFGSKDKYNASASLNLKNRKLNVYGNYSFRSNHFAMSGTSSRTNTVDNSLTTLLEPTNGNFKMLANLIKAGIDYNLAEKQVLGFSTTLRFSNRDRGFLSTSSLYDNAGLLNSQSTSFNDETENGYDLEASLNYLAKFKTPKQQLSMEATFSREKEDEGENLDNQYYIIDYVPVNVPNGLWNIDRKQYQNFFNYQADYTHPFGKDSKLDLGYKSTYRLHDEDYYSQHLDSATNIWVIDYDLNNRFKYNLFVNALYASYADEFGNFGFQVGLRSELTYSKGDLVNSPEKNFTKNYIDFFPSVSLTEKIGKSNEFQLSYTRRLNRPRSGMLNPFIEANDPYNIRKGNPDLNPEYIDGYELSYLKYFKGAIITSSVFMRQTKGLISRYRIMLDSVTSLTYPINVSKANSYGFEFIANLQTPAWLNLNGSFSYYKTDIEGGDNAAELTNSGYTWSTKFLATIKMWLGLELAMAYNYQSKRPTVDGYINPVQSLDVSLKRVFMGKKLDMSMRVSDLFNTQEFRTYSSNTGYSQNSSMKRDSRVVFITLTYRFGNIFENQDRKERKRNNGDDVSPPDIEY